MATAVLSCHPETTADIPMVSRKESIPYDQHNEIQ
jgi:hypothetical protein